MRVVILLSALTLSSIATLEAPAQDEKENLAARARKVLQSHCWRCHGDKGTVEGGVNYMLDRARLVSRKKVVPGGVAKSRLFRRVSAGEMPPEGEKRPSKEEIDILKRWIASGAPDFNSSPPRRTFITPQRVRELIATDLEKLPERERLFRRYFTFTHLYNAGVSDDELETYRQALSKLLNSLSWNRTIVPPTAVDEARTIYRIDLVHYRWTERTWALLLTRYPYLVRWGSESEQKLQEAEAQFTPVRGDWFVASAALPQLYHRLLNLPLSDKALENELRVKVDVNLQGGDVLRAGFNGSGVSANNRLIERHESLWGAYWKSYDFASNTGRQNLFSFPLGPDAEPTSFRHDGGEIIFSLPNGLHAYMLVDSRGRRIDTGPIRVVSDPRRPDRMVVNGLSCMSCHVRGIISKEDQVREAVLKNRKAFKPAEIEDILALYPPREKLLATMKEDADRYLKAVEKTGCKIGRTEPIVALAVRFEADLDLDAAASELYLTPVELKKKIETSFFAARALGPLAVAGGVVSRQTFETGFGQLVNDLALGRAGARVPGLAHRATPSWLEQPGPWSPPPAGLLPTPRPRPTVRIPEPKDVRERFFEDLIWQWRRNDHQQLEFTRHTSGQIQALAGSPTDARLAVELSPGLIGIFDPNQPGKVVKLEGHSRPIQAVRFSGDGKLLASVSQDRTVRIWNSTTGREVFKLALPRTAPRAVCFSPDGKWIAIGSEQVDIWDAKTGKHVRKCDLRFGDIHDLVFSPDGTLLASVGREVRLWDPAMGKSVETLRKHRGTILSVAFSPDGKWLATGGSDGSICLWDPKERTNTSTMEQGSAVSSLMFTKDGKHIITAGESRRGSASSGVIRVWELSAPVALAELKIDTRINNLVVSHDGKCVMTAGGDRSIRIWDMPKVSAGPFQGHLEAISALATSPDGKVVLTGSRDKSARLWDSSGKLLQRFLGHTSGVDHVAVTPDGKRSFTTSADRTLRLWDNTTGEQLRRWDLPRLPTGMALSPDGKMLALCFFEGELRLINLATDEVRDLKERKGVRHMTFSADGKRLAVTGLFALSIRLWDVNAGKEAAVLEGVRSPLGTLAFSPDGKFLAGAGGDRDIRLWDLEKGQLIRRLEGHSMRVHQLVFSRDGSQLYSVSGNVQKSLPPRPSKPGKRPSTPDTKDCALRLWDVSSGKQLKSWESFPYEITHLAIDPENRQALLVFGGIVYRQSLSEPRTAKEIAATPK